MQNMIVTKHKIQKSLVKNNQLKYYQRLIKIKKKKQKIAKYKLLRKSLKNTSERKGLAPTRFW